MHKNGKNDNSYAGSRYRQIVEYIRRRYTSLSEYIVWERNTYNYLYISYYNNACECKVLKRDIDVVFATENDRKRIAEMCK